MQAKLHAIMDFLHLAEKLKFELRHSWLSNGRRESVAEHSWRLALMALALAPQLEHPVQLEKSLKMALIHDIVEAEAGDIPSFECTSKEDKVLKQQREQQAITNIRDLLNDEIGDEIYALWQEFEAHQSIEAKFVMALDKLEVFLQHTEADLSTWLEKEKRMLFQPQWREDYCQHDATLQQFNDMITQAAIEKFMANDEDVEAIRSAAQQEELA